MTTWILLLRGINVGGRNKMSMKELRRLLESLGLGAVQTYIQSGNVVFRGPEDLDREFEKRVAAAIEDRHGFQPRVLLRTAEEVALAVEANPFPQAAADSRTLHFFFLKTEPAEPDLEALAEARRPSERFHLDGRVFYLHAPDGIGRSRLASKAERLLGVPATARNGRTVGKLLQMAEEL